VYLVRFRVAYLGNPLGTDEAACFDIRDAGSNQSVHEFGFHLHRDDTAFLVLESVPWPDFNNVDNIVGNSSS